MHLPTGLDEGVPVCGTALAGKEDFDQAGWGGGVALGAQAGAAGEKAGGDDAGVVEDEEVAGTEEAREVEETAVGEGTGGAVDGEHAGGVALGGRVLGDEFGGQVEVKVGNAHGC